MATIRWCRAPRNSSRRRHDPGHRAASAALAGAVRERRRAGTRRGSGPASNEQRCDAQGGIEQLLNPLDARRLPWRTGRGCCAPPNCLADRNAIMARSRLTPNCARAAPCCFDLPSARWRQPAGPHAPSNSPRRRARRRRPTVAVDDAEKELTGMSEPAARVDLSGDERKLLAFAQGVAAPYAAYEGALPLAALQEIFASSNHPAVSARSCRSRPAARACRRSPSRRWSRACRRHCRCSAIRVCSATARFRLAGAMCALPAGSIGDEIGAIAISETQAASDLSRIETTATRHGRGWKITGRKTWATHGMVASLFIVLARNGDAPGQFTRLSSRRICRALCGGHLNRSGLSTLLCRAGTERLRSLRRAPARWRRRRRGRRQGGVSDCAPAAALQALRAAQAAIEITADYARERIVAGSALVERSLVPARPRRSVGAHRGGAALAYRAAANFRRPRRARWRRAPRRSAASSRWRPAAGRPTAWAGCCLPRIGCTGCTTTRA